MPKKGEIRQITALMFRNWKIMLLIVTFDILFVLFLVKVRFIQISLDKVFFPLFAGGKTYLIYSPVLAVFLDRQFLLSDALDAFLL